MRVSEAGLCNRWRSPPANRAPAADAASSTVISEHPGSAGGGTASAFWLCTLSTRQRRNGREGEEDHGHVEVSREPRVCMSRHVTRGSSPGITKSRVCRRPRLATPPAFGRLAVGRGGRAGGVQMTLTVEEERDLEGRSLVPLRQLDLISTPTGGAVGFPEPSLSRCPSVRSPPARRAGQAASMKRSSEPERRTTMARR